MVLKDYFRSVVVTALKDIKISNSDIVRFVKTDSKVTLADLHICSSISDVFDNTVRRYYKGYSASLITDTFDKLYEYNCVPNRDD